MCLSHASLRLDEVYYFSTLGHSITRNTPMFLSFCYPGTQKLQSFWFKEMMDSDLWHGNKENPVISCLKHWTRIKVLATYMWIWGKRVTVKSAWRVRGDFSSSFGQKKKKKSKQRHRMGAKWCCWLEETSEMSRTSLNYQNGLLKQLNGLVKRLQYSPTILCTQAVQEAHCFKRPCDTQEKAGNVLDTHAIPQTLSCPG